MKHERNPAPVSQEAEDKRSRGFAHSEKIIAGMKAARERKSPPAEPKCAECGHKKSAHMPTGERTYCCPRCNGWRPSRPAESESVDGPLPDVRAAWFRYAETFPEMSDREYVTRRAAFEAGWEARDDQ